MTPNEVAEMLMVSPVTVRQWAQKGRLKAHKTPGGHRRFLIQDVEQYGKDRGLTLKKEASDELRILIIDDDVQFSGFLVEFLTSSGPHLSVETAVDGFSAGSLVRSFHPHCVLLDLKMPGLDGISVCELIKKDPQTKLVRVIGMTGYYTQENVNRIISAGAETCLAKPVNEQVLLRAIGITDNLEHSEVDVISHAKSAVSKS